MPQDTRYRRDAAAIRRGYAVERAAARARNDREEIERIEWSEDHELGELAEEREARITASLLAQAERLKVPLPPRTDDMGEDTEFWERGSRTGARYLTEHGVKRLREEIRTEKKARREERAYWLPFIQALTGLVGVLIALATVLNKPVPAAGPQPCVQAQAPTPAASPPATATPGSPPPRPARPADAPPSHSSGR